jgi:perosamine synthetase
LTVSAEERDAGAAVAIPMSVPVLAGREWEYLRECLDSNWVSSSGPFVGRFEEVFAEHVGAAEAVAVTTGTAALHVALLVAGVQPDDEVLVSDLTFIAPTNAIRYVGAWPILVDAEPNHWQMDPRLVEGFLREACRMEDGHIFNRASGRHVSAILPVHILGHPCDMDAIGALAAEFGLQVIEDATESLGATYRGRPAGTIGDVGCYSFNGNKTITTGGGGMIVSRNAAWIARARYLATQAKDDPNEYIHGAIGFNYRLTNLQAALGCAQMEQLEGFLARRREIAQRYRESLDSVAGLTMMTEGEAIQSSWWLSTVLVEADVYGRDRRELQRRLGERGIESRPLWQPMHMSPVYRDAQTLKGDVAERLWGGALSLPSSPSMTSSEQDQVIEALHMA